jgi:hypothetical protein
MNGCVQLLVLLLTTIIIIECLRAPRCRACFVQPGGFALWRWRQGSALRTTSPIQAQGRRNFKPLRDTVFTRLSVRLNANERLILSVNLTRGNRDPVINTILNSCFVLLCTRKCHGYVNESENKINVVFMPKNKTREANRATWRKAQGVLGLLIFLHSQIL